MVVQKPDERQDADTWPGVASRLLDAVLDDWRKLAHACVLLVFLALVGAAWWWLRW